ncbi:MAG: NAD(P)-dependent alcohol dehydrogenase [Phormidesmis sp. RL_2_1]|nr:NAD(P)-dependent alcohol dehydrogenase [Phormidesmis sp. RL_2_1]
MKAIVQSEYGPADVLRLAEVAMPICDDDGVLVKVKAASVNAGDWHLMKGDPFLARPMFGGLLKPKIKTLGFDIAGRVEAVGKNVIQFCSGDEVYGDISDYGFGAFAEYVCVPAVALAPKPTALTLEQAAAIPGAAMTALQALRDQGQLRPQQRVLVNGASGGVGSFAVQIAKALGAEVTAVCSTRKVDMVRSLHPDHILDYTKTDITQTGQSYDLIVDAAAYRSVFDYFSILKPEGTYVLIGGSTARLFQAMLLSLWFSKPHRRQIKSFIVKPNQADLLFLKELIEAGKIKPFIDRTYALSEVPMAIRQLEQRQVRGKAVIQI